MKRLKNILLNMQPNNTTYKEIYEGEMVVYDPNYPNMPPIVAYEATYWRDDIRYDIEHTHKLAQDKPSVKIGIPAAMLGINNFNDTAADFCLREFKLNIDELNELNRNRSRSDKENGKYYLYTPGSEILKRNASFFEIMNQKYYISKSGNSVSVLPEGTCGPPISYLCIMLQIQLPYKKYRKAIRMLCKDLPDAIDRFILNFDRVRFINAMKLSEKQAEIRKWLQNSEYCAFIANGSILPRLAGTDLPLEKALPFKSPPEAEIEIHGIKGMGIKKGVTVITGGGYSGKSTLLDAINAGIYDHIEGDGRELVITDRSAAKISAEDGRSVKNVNISPFLKWLPNGDTADFSTDHASGSTSQAANIIEAINNGCKLLLIDEDKSATNFMIRDRLMKDLIEKEPIIPFTDRVNELYEKMGVSTVLVIGGSGEYLSIANKIYMMQDFLIFDITERAKQICCKTGVISERPKPTEWLCSRVLLSESLTSYPKDSGTEILKVSDIGFIFIGDEKIDTRMLHNIISPAQLNSIGYILRYIEITNNDNGFNPGEKLDELYTKIEENGLDYIYTSFFTNNERWFEMPRKNEVLAVINRMRKIKLVKYLQRV